jgi:hypothetical protein
MASDSTVIDDSVLLQDRLMRSLHRNRDGHLSGSKKGHSDAVLETHNIATLYVYTADSDSYMLHEHYIFSHTPLSYADWLKLVIRECFKIEESRSDSYYGIYGWMTNFLRITPMRTGDLFIKIDSEGAKGVRLTFNTGTDKYEAHNKKK